MTRHTDLISRLESGSGADEALDAEIVAHFNNAIVKRYPPTDDFGPRSRWQFWSKDSAHFLGNESKFPLPAYTSSLDAALSLVERMLPGWPWIVYHDGAELVSPVTAGPIYYGRAKTPPRSLVAALLRALDQEPHP